MSPAAIQLALLIIEEAIKLEPTIAAGLADLFSKGEPKPEDWQKLRDHTASLQPFKMPV